MYERKGKIVIEHKRVEMAFEKKEEENNRLLCLTKLIRT